MHDVTRMDLLARQFDEMPREPGGVAVLTILLVALIAGLARFLWEGHVGFNLWDEGYLWYGVQRVMHGEMPVRDFASYDLGRYYWAAWSLQLFHEHGIVAVREATAAFGAIGVVGVGLLVLKGSAGRMAMRLVLGVLAMALCVLWMVPWWKSYDATVSVLLTASLAGVLARPSTSRFFLHGLVIGLAAVLGRNHGLYGVVACLLATPVLVLGASPLHWRRCIPAWSAGVALGFAPVLISLLLDHRFAAMFWESIRFILFEYKGTNLPLPVPWPWTVPFAHQPWPTVIRPYLVGCLFVALPVFCIWGGRLILWRAWRDRVVAHPLFAASVLTAIPYLNVAFSRADVGHLAQAILPCLIGIFVYPRSPRVRVITQWLGVPAIVLATLYAVAPLHAGYLFRVQTGWVPVNVRGDRLWMSPDNASTVQEIQKLARRYLGPGETLLSVPVWPGAYALLGLRSPVYEIYPLVPRSDGFQDQEIDRLAHANPHLILFNDIAVDGRADLRYPNTHPRIWNYITTHYRRIAVPTENPQLKVYIPN